MQIRAKGLAAALLLMPLLMIGGCAGKNERYLAGLETGDMGFSQAAHGTAVEDAQNTEEPEMAGARKDGKSIPEDPGQEAGLADGYVYVCGAVKNPGVYPAAEGMRLFEAVELAGGFTEEADEQWLNQAEVLHDGQRLYVYTKEEVQQLAKAEPFAGASRDLAEGQDGKVNLNTATREELMALPGIGGAKADAVIAYRSEQGGFSSIEEIQNIPGIKSAVFSKIKDQITV